MEVYRFKNDKSKEVKTYTVAVIVGLIFSIILFSGTSFSINPSILYLLATIVSAISIIIEIKKSGKEFKEIMIEEDYIKFYFFNKMKDALVIDKKDILVKIDEEKIEFENKSASSQIGRSYKNKMEDIQRWDELITHLE